MVFIVNVGLVLGENVVLSCFYYKECQGEEFYFKVWFEENGFIVYELFQDLFFEGVGDVLFDWEGCWLWVGYGFCFELDFYFYIVKWLDIEVVFLWLIDECFYYFDICFCFLSGGYLFYYFFVFDVYFNWVIEMWILLEKRIIVEELDVVNFVCNVVNVNDIIIMNLVS